MAIELHEKAARRSRQQAEALREHIRQVIRRAADPAKDEVVGEAHNSADLAKRFDAQAKFFELVAGFMGSLVQRGYSEPSIELYLDVLKEEMRPKEGVVEETGHEANRAVRHGVTRLPGRRREVIIGQDRVTIAAKRQYPIVELLRDRAGSPVSVDELARKSYGRADAVSVQNVRNNINRIRADLKKANVAARIETIEDGGYRLVVGQAVVAELSAKKEEKQYDLPTAAARLKISDAQLRLYVEKKILKEGVDFRREKRGSRTRILLTDAGLQQTINIEKAKRRLGGKRPRIETIKKAMEGFLRREKRVPDYHQVRMTSAKAANLADLLSIAQDLGRSYDFQILPDDREFYRQTWDAFCKSGEAGKFNAGAFREKIIPKLKRDLLSFSEDPAAAYLFHQDRQDLAKYSGPPELISAYRRVVGDVQLLLEKISSEKRGRFIEELLAGKGSILRQDGVGLPVSRYDSQG